MGFFSFFLSAFNLGGHSSRIFQETLVYKVNIINLKIVIIYFDTHYMQIRIQTFFLIADPDLAFSLQIKIPAFQNIE